MDFNPPHECRVSDKKGAFLSSHLEMQYLYFFFLKEEHSFIETPECSCIQSTPDP